MLSYVFMVFFLVVNVFVSIFLEKRRWHVATILQAVVFTLILIMMAIAYGDSLFGNAMRYILGDNNYRLLGEVLRSNAVSSFLPLFAIQTLIPVLALIESLIAAVGIVSHMLRSGCSVKSEIKQLSQRFEHVHKMPVIEYKKVKKNCVMLC